MNNKDGLLSIMIFLLTMLGMAATSPDQRLPPVSLSPVIRIVIASAEVRAHLAKA